MSTVNGNGDLKLMEEYDFKTPINATVIFCDDDEDKSTTIVEKEQNSDDVNNNLDHFVYGIIQDINKITKQGNQARTANIIPRSKSNNRKSVKKKKTDFHTKANSQELGDHNQTLIIDTQNTNNNQTATNSQGSNNHPLFCIQQLVYPSNQDDSSQTVNKCVQALLDTVSTNLVLIMKAFEEFKQISLKTSDAGALQNAWKRYYEIKFRFFYLSFSTVSNIMIPKENDSVFLENFINNTIKLAKIRHNIHCQPTETSSLYTEMYRWVKSKMKNPVISDLLHREYIPHTNSLQEQQGCSTNSGDSTCLFRSGPADRELTISVSQTIINNSQSTTLQGNQPYKMPITQNVMPSAGLRNDTAYNTQEYNSYCSYKQTPTHPYKSTPRTSRNQLTKAGRNQLQHQTYHYYNHQTPSAQTSQSLPCCLPPQNNQQSVPSTVMNTQNYTESPFTNQAIYSHQGEELEVNRSLSRDSGFMSPSTSASNETCSPRYEFDPSASATPLITHVTSLNPSVAFINDGACHVCGKLTKQKCLGCFKCYYCSHRCQMVDWKYHYMICKTM